MADQTQSLHNDVATTATRTKRYAVNDIEPSASSRKRGRYVFRACDRCKIQKIRCNGEKPCNRCEKKRHVECSYLNGRRVISRADWGVSNGFSQPQMNNYNFGVDQSTQRNLPNASNSWNVTGSRIAPDRTPLSHLLDAVHSQTDQLVNHAMSLHNFVARAKKVRTEDTNTAAEAKVLSMFRPVKKSLPLFTGPSSPAFTFDVVRTTLNKLESGLESRSLEVESSHEGITLTGNGNSESEVARRAYFHDSEQRPSMVTEDDAGSAIKLLQTIGMDATARLLRLYDDLLGAMPPIVDIEYFMHQARELNKVLDRDSCAIAATTSTTNADGLQLDKNGVNILVIVLSIALMAETQGHSEMGFRLYRSVQSDLQRKILGEETDLEGIILLILASFYHFYNDTWRSAWHMGRYAARVALELGLHQQDVLLRRFPDSRDRDIAIKVFWSIYVLDRQWSVIAGLPRNLQDVNIDPNLQEPDDAAYLKLMVWYVRLGGNTWDSILKLLNGGVGGTRDSHELLGTFYYQLEQWQKSIPENLQFSCTDSSADNVTLFLRASLHLRANQLHLFVLRPFLRSHAGISVYPQLVESAAEIACDTIRVLGALNASTDIYCMQQPICNYFLTTAIGVLLLITVHSPSLSSMSSKSISQLTTNIGMFQELLVALELLKVYATSCRASKKLWEEISALILRLNRLRLLPGCLSGQFSSIISGPRYPQSLTYDWISNPGARHSQSRESPVVQPASTVTTQQTISDSSWLMDTARGHSVEVSGEGGFRDLSIPLWNPSLEEAEELDRILSDELFFR